MQTITPSSKDCDSFVTSTPAWMQDPEIASISPEKLALLLQFKEKTIGLNKKNAMATILSLAKEAKEQNLQFTNEELKLLMTTVKKYATTEEQEKIEAIEKRANT